MKRTLRYFCTVVFLSAAASVSANPMNDAVAVWQMDGLANSRGSDGKGNHALTVHGDVTLGVPLETKDAEASKQRGGDGKVARFTRGSYLSAGGGADSKLNITGKTMTIAMRIKSASGAWNSPVLSRHGGHANLAYNIYSTEDRLGCEFRTTKNNGLLSASVVFSDMLPVENGRAAWHDIVCRVDGAKLEMFVDGRCVDENFMLGDFRGNDLPLLFGAEDTGNGMKAGFEGDMDHVAIWNRALSNDEIITLAGGKNVADLRERTDRGIVGESLQYWRPPNNYYVGDTLPFWDEKTQRFHFAYLLDREHHGAKNGYGAHQWAQASSADLVNWTHHPMILPVTEQWEGSICTGSVFIHDGKYYAFYATRAVRDVPAPNGNTYEGEFAAFATSDDGIHFTKQEPNPLVVLKREDGYSRAGRDPVVFQDERDGLFHMYITSNYKGNGCWAHLTSKDLKDWTLERPVLAGGGDPECPDWFKWGDTYYLIINWGNGFYRVSKTPIGPWEKPNGPDKLMAGAPRVPKTAAYKDGRRLITGWTNENGFGGHAVFHELIRHEDGTLGEKFVPEMLPKTGEPVISEVEISGQEKMFDVPEHYRLQAVLEFDADKLDSLGEWTLTYYQDASNKESIRVVPRERAIYLGTRNNPKLENVDFSKGQLVLDMFLKNRVVDLCVDNVKAVTNTVPAFEFREVRMNETPRRRNQQDQAGYTLKNLRISPLR